MKENRASSPTFLSKISTNRRTFLKTSIAGTALLACPGIILAAAGDAERKIKLGLIGCGRRGTWLAGLFNKHGGYTIHAVADYFQKVADDCGQTFAVPDARRFSTLSGYKRLMESGVEAVALEAPPCFYPEHAAAAVEAGLHVYMAKPVAVDVPGCMQIKKSAEKSGASKKVFLVDYQLPTDPENIKVCDSIKAGAIGRVVSLNSHYLAGSFADPPKTDTLESRFQRLIWVNDNALGGGYHVNACIHAIDAGLWLAGQAPEWASGVSRIARPDPHGDSHDVFQLTLAFPNGVLMSHRGKHLDNLTGFDVACTAQGQTGYASVGYGGRASLKGPEEAFTGEVKDLYEAGAVRNIAAFHKAVLSGDHSNPTVARAVDSALATILGRDAAEKRSCLTMAELLRANVKREVSLKGLKS